jgi:hypothetical protein
VRAHEPTDDTSRLSRRIGLLVGFAVLAALPAIGLGAYAAADTAGGESATADAPSYGRVAPAPPSDEQLQCLADLGVTLPEPNAANPEPGERPQPQTEERQAAFRAAAEQCNLPVPVHGSRPGERIA